MKKSLLITLDFPPYIGGVANYYSNICKNLLPEDICVLAPNTKNTEKFDTQQKYKIIRKQLLSSNPFAWPKWMKMIKAAKETIRSENIETIIVGNVLPVGTVALYLKKKLDIPYYVFTHGMDITMPRGRKKVLLKKILQNADGVFSNSKFLMNEIHQNGVEPRNIEVVYPCANIIPDVSEISNIELKNKYELNNKKILLTAGRLVPRKGHNIVLRALPKILKKHGDAHYVIAGDGPQKQELEKITKALNIQNNVTFTGAIEDDIMHGLLDICDIFVMTPYKTSHNDIEGFGIVYLEASHFGKPIVATDTGGVSEAVEDNVSGILVEPKNHTAVADAIIDLLDHPNKAHRLGFQGMDRVHEMFSWERQAQKVKKILS